MPAGAMSGDAGTRYPAGALLGMAVLAGVLAVVSPAGAAAPARSVGPTAGAEAGAVPGPSGAPRPAAATAAGAGVRPVPGEVLAGFDPPASPYGPGQRGVRLAAPDGAVVRAARAGEVAFAGPVAGTPWVSLDHGGELRTSYGPVEPAVEAGERVAAGEVIGRVAPGDEPGLHWGARLQGAYIDPMGLLGRWRPVLVPRR